MINDLIKFYLKNGMLEKVNEEDYLEVVLMCEDIKTHLTTKSEIKHFFEFCGIMVNYIEMSSILAKHFFVKHGVFDYIRFVDDFYNFLTLCEKGYFDNIITPENIDKTFIYLFIGYAIKSDWFLPMDININNINLNLN